MSSALHDALQSAIASKRLGRPVFVRYTLLCHDRKALPAELAQSAAVVIDWLGELSRLYAVGSLEKGHVALTLEFREGGSALVSASAKQADPRDRDLMIVGNRGAVYFDFLRATSVGTAGPDRAQPGNRLLELVERSLRSGRPERFGGE